MAFLLLPSLHNALHEDDVLVFRQVLTLCRALPEEFEQHRVVLLLESFTVFLKVHIWILELN